MAPDGSSDEVTGDLPIDGNSLAHGWATSPLTALSEHVLGAGPVEPGYAESRLTPHLGDLLWAEGAVPTPSGPIELRWRQNDARTLLIGEVTAPAGTRGTIVLRVGETATVYFDGQRVEPGAPIAVEGERASTRSS